MLTYTGESNKLLPKQDLEAIVERFQRDRAQKADKWNKALQVMRQIDMQRRQQTP